MEGDMVLIMVDECGDEIEVACYNLSLELDEDELEIWKERKITKAEREWPEARGFYFEDRRYWKKAIIADIRRWF